MRLRRITEHVRDQNWTAVGIDFVIVVVGVFLGIQVANWNEAQSERARERLLLGELRAELAESIDQLKIKRSALAGRASGRSRSWTRARPVATPAGR